MRPYILALASLLLAPAASAQPPVGSCINAGQWASMLLHAKSCPRLVLLPEGTRLLSLSVGQAYARGGDWCVSEGRKEMMAHLVGRHPPLESAISSGRQRLVDEALCDAIYGYLSERRDKHGGPPLVGVR
ncbi:MAG: hypothetical protein NW223_24320 [Hyphomicrobiaceae bacterium]|nr:hypothetical protein [Hyphomicrobiaceae bacterium]